MTTAKLSKPNLRSMIFIIFVSILKESKSIQIKTKMTTFSFSLVIKALKTQIKKNIQIKMITYIKIMKNKSQK
jgi:hypothetical protein